MNVKTEKLKLWAPDEENTLEALLEQAAAHNVKVTSVEVDRKDGDFVVEYEGREDDLRWLLHDIYKSEYSHEGWFVENGVLKAEGPVT